MINHRDFGHEFRPFGSESRLVPRSQPARIVDDRGLRFCATPGGSGEPEGTVGEAFGRLGFSSSEEPEDALRFGSGFQGAE